MGAITAPLSPNPVNTAIGASASFTDLDGGSHTAAWNWGDGSTSAGTVTPTGNTTGSVTGSHTYAAAGVYTLTLTVTGPDQLSGQATFQFVVIYDPSAGFITGGGWITSPAGAYISNPSLTGKANFGFNAKYKRNSTIPDGDTEFRFQAANLNFHTTSYDWLVLTSPQAQYQGSGTINGTGNYGFFVTGLDGKQPGGGGTDKVRVKIWDKNNGNAVIYDTQPGAAQTAVPTTALGGGEITIHTNGGGAAPPSRPGHGEQNKGSLTPVLLDRYFASHPEGRVLGTIPSPEVPLLTPNRTSRTLPITGGETSSLTPQRTTLFSQLRREHEAFTGWASNSLENGLFDALAASLPR